MNSSRNRVLIISYPFPPAVSAGVQRTMRFVKHLPSFDWEPVVLTVRTDVERVVIDPELSNYLPQANHIWHSPMWRPVDRLAKFATLFRRTKKRTVKAKTDSSGEKTSKPPVANSPKDRRGFGWLRKLTQLLFETPDPKIWWAIPALPRALRMVWKLKPQVIYSTAPPHSSHLLACVLGLLTRRPIVLDFRDPWARSPWHAAQNGAEFKWLNGLFEWICIACSSVVLLNTDRVRDEFNLHYGPKYKRKFVTLPNGFDLDQVASIESEKKPCECLKDTFELVHPGTIYGKRDLQPLFHAIKILRAKGYSVRFSQIGIFKQDYNAELLLKELEIEDQVRFCGVLSHGETMRRMSQADILVVIQPDTPLQIPSKLYEMMLFDKPVLALTGEGATADLVSKYGLGLVADPGDVNAIATALSDLKSHIGDLTPSLREQALRDFDGRTLTKRLADILSSLNSVT